MPTDKPADPTLDSTAKAEGQYKAWMNEISNALTREKTFRKKGRESVDLYEAKDADNTPFAILYSNVEVLAPAVYNSRPIPIVQRRYKDSDPVGKAVCDVGTRMLKYLVDSDSANYDSFDELMQPAVLDGILTNRGLTRFKFVPENNRECVYGEAVRWDKFFHGYARTWKKVPWIGFEWDMTQDEIRKNFPDLPLDFSNFASFTEEDSKDEGETTEQLKGVNLCQVFEIWDKRARKVYFFSACYNKGPLKVVDDPLNLTGFFPVPRPLNFMKKVTTLVPTPLYEQYRQQALELNDITRRLKAIIKAIKYRGAYNAAVEGIEKILAAGDNDMIPVENVQSMPDGTGMDKLLWTVPIQELAATAQSLYQQREAVKQVIYEITGISDILRGASAASETATAQNIKNQWGSLRVKRMQKEVQRYCRESLAIIFEIACSRFELQTIMQMTGAPYQTMAQKQQAVMQFQMQAAQQMQQQAPALPGAPPPPGMAAGSPMPGQMPAPMPAPQPPQIPPELQAQLQQPSWEDIYGLMKQSVARNYKIDIETNSTIDAEASQDKQDISELLNALSQFLNGLAPLVQQGLMPFTVAKDMLLTIARRYNFGAQLEDSLNAMTEPPKPQGDPAAEQKAQQAQMEAQAAAQKAQQEMQLGQMEFENKKQLMVMEAQLAQQELRIKERELELQEKAVGLKLQLQTVQHNQKLQMLSAQANAAQTKEPANASV